MKDEGSMDEYVGCSVITNKTGNIVLHQPHLLKKIREEFGKELEDVQTPATPARTGDVIIKMDSEEKEKAGLNRWQQTRYQSGVGMLLYLVKFSRPDIANPVRELTKSMDCANEAHYKSLLWALKYVLTMSQLGIEYNSGSTVNLNGKWKIVAYCDSDFDGDKIWEIVCPDFVSTWEVTLYHGAADLKRAYCYHQERQNIMS